MASKHLDVGPGGRRCVCCFPAPGSKHRAHLYRSAKRRNAAADFHLAHINEDDDLEGEMNVDLDDEGVLFDEA